MQMDTNAETSDIYTEYYFQAVENIDIGIKTILDAVNNVKFNEENLNKLKKPYMQLLAYRDESSRYHPSSRTISSGTDSSFYLTRS